MLGKVHIFEKFYVVKAFFIAFAVIVQLREKYF